MNINNVIKAIQAMKLDIPSSDEVVVEMRVLEILETTIKEQKDILYKQTVTIEKQSNSIKQNYNKIDLLNSMAKSCLRKKNIKDYL